MNIYHNMDPMAMSLQCICYSFQAELRNPGNLTVGTCRVVPRHNKERKGSFPNAMQIRGYRPNATPAIKALLRDDGG